MDYIKFLTSFLHDHGLTVDVNDYVRFGDDARTPILVDGRRLALPTERHRRNPTDDTILFHPLAENTVADLSASLKEIMRLGSTNLNILFATYGIEVIQVASDTGRQVSLTDAQIDLIAKLRSCKSSAEKNVAKIASELMVNYSVKKQTSGFIQLGLVRGRVYRGEKRHRACSVAFPLYDSLVADLNVPKAQAKIPMTGDVRATLIELHEAIFPAVAEPEAYGYADVTNRTIAPFFVTYARTYAQLAEAFKVIFKTLTGVTTFSADDEPPLLDWVKDLDNHDLIRRWSIEIPDQSSYRAAEEGSSYVAEDKSDKEQCQSESHPATQPAPAPKKAGTMTPDEYMRSYAGNSTFTTQQTVNGMLKDYIEGYKKFWDSYLNQYRIAPVGMPHPQQLPHGVLPPQYPGCPPLPPGFMPGSNLNAPQMQMQMQAQPQGYQMTMMHPMGGMMMPNNGAMGYGAAMMYGQPGYPQQGGVSSHPAFAGTAVGQGTVAPGTI